MGAQPAYFVAAGQQLAGTVAVEGSAFIFGRLRGELRANAVWVWPGGEVIGTVIAERITVLGIAGPELAAEEFSVARGARVYGQVVYGRLEIHAGAVVDARLHHRQRLAAAGGAVSPLSPRAPSAPRRRVP